MRHASSLAVLVISAIQLSVARPVSGAETATTSVCVLAQVSSRTSLRVSTDILLFEAAMPGQVTAAVDFSAGARTYSGAEVVLSVEQLRDVDGPERGSDVPSGVTFGGDGNGTHDGVLRRDSPSVVGRWIGSGLRQGRVVFVLQAGARGTFVVPVRFILSAP